MIGLEFLGLVAGIAVLAIPFAVVFLLVRVGALKRRIEELERRSLAQGEGLRRLMERPETPRGAAPAAEAIRPADEVAAAPPDPAGADTETPASPGAEAELPAPIAGGDDAAEATPAAPAGPWSMPAAGTPPPRPTRRGPQRASALADWLKVNWVYAVSALSLALAGVFFVQYGVENGLLPPALRVAAAVAFGLVLIGAGEWLRRRWGDREEDATAYLPSTFSGAGLVSIFAGILAARQLYGLIGAETTFAALIATALLAIVLGWFHGPFLAAVGLIGAAAAPFVVGGDSEAPYWLYAYFAIIAGVGLAVDTIRRWAWVSALALVLGYAGGALVFAGTGGAGWFALLLAALVFLAICVPARGLFPDHAGPMIAEALALRGKGGRPAFPTLLAAGAVAVSSGLLVMLPAENGAESILAFLCLTTLALALALWSDKARALADLTLLPAAGFLVRLGFEGADGWPLAREFAAAATELRAPETAAPWTVSLLLAMALAMTLAAARMSGRTGWLRPFWAAGAALVAPLAALVLELFWAPSQVLGAYPWALHVIALAALMVAMALAFARADGDDRRRAAYATLSALSLIALALFLITTKGALTLALGALLVTAAALDRRFRLPEMGWFIQAAVLVLSWRLIVYPGLPWAVEDAALWEVIASYGGAVVATAAAHRLLAGLSRQGASVFLESAFAGYAAIFANVLITRALTRATGGEWTFSHWALTLNAMPWIILMLVQLYRLKLGGVLRWLRWGIAALAAVIGLAGLAAAVLPANPLVALFGGPESRVLGPLVLDTLFVAYALPGIVLLVALTRLGHLHRLLRGLIGLIGVALVALYAVLEIRRFWQGDDLSGGTVSQPELYSYTIALLLVGAALLYQAIARRSQGLRRAAMAVIGLTIAKVFLIDISGLSGLTRVFSFLALGLSLAGLAWLNRWAAGRPGKEG